MTTVQWGMIGCGNVAEVKSGPSLSMATDSRLVMVMSNDAAKVEDYARRHGVPRWTVDAEALINDPEVTAVYIATPPDSHRHYCEMVARAGKPMLTEKPMACNLADAEAMAEACAKAGVPLYVAYYRRPLPRYLTIKRLLNEGRIGTPRLFLIHHLLRAEDHPVSPVTAKDVAEGTIHWRFIPEVGGGGNFPDMGTHMVDMIDNLLGPIVRVDGHAANLGGLYRAEDTVTAHFVLENGVQGVGQWCYVAGCNVDRTEIIGTEGRISYSCFTNDPVVIETRAGVERLDFPMPANTHVPIIQSAVDDLLGRGKCVSTHENGLRYMRVQEKLLASYYGRPVPSFL